MTGSERLQPIAKIRKQQEHHAGRLHGETLRQAELQQKQLEALIGYRDQYTQSLQTISKTGLSAIQMQEYRLFINRLDDAITQQKNHVNNEQNKCELSQKEWMNKRSKSKIIEKVVENRQLEEHHAMEKREQRDLENRPQSSISNRF